jgi:hypothetical protein
MLPKFTAAGETTAGAIPVPVSDKAFGLSGALVVIVNAPAETAPTEVGVNVTEILQLPDAASELPHVVADTRNPAEGVIEEIVMDVDWLL